MCMIRLPLLLAALVIALSSACATGLAAPLRQPGNLV